MAEALRYLDTTDGEMGWSVPSVGAAEHSIAYDTSKKEYSDFASPMPNSAKVGELVTVGINAGGQDMKPVEYVGWLPKGTAVEYKNLRDIADAKGMSYIEYKFTMPDSDVVVAIIAN